MNDIARIGLRHHQPSTTEFVRISADEREREHALRERVANFWGHRDRKAEGGLRRLHLGVSSDRQRRP
jgi:hypothetical protein